MCVCFSIWENDFIFKSSCVLFCVAFAKTVNANKEEHYMLVLVIFDYILADLASNIRSPRIVVLLCIFRRNSHTKNSSACVNMAVRKKNNENG